MSHGDAPISADKWRTRAESAAPLTRLLEFRDMRLVPMLYGMLLVGFLRAGTVHAQSPSNEVTPATPALTTLSPTGNTLKASDPAPVAYWRVGTRPCGQGFAGICNCRLVVAACDACGCETSATEQEMLAALQPGVPVCIMVHGSRVDERGSRIDSLGTYRWLNAASANRPIHMIFFDWPSDQPVGLLPNVQFTRLGEQAARNGFPIARLISSLPADSPVCLMGHSHGARAVVSATHVLAGGVVQDRCLGWVDRQHRIRLVLAAAAIDHQWLNPGQPYDRAVCRAECVVNMVNRTDYALLLYPLQKPFTTRALGQSGLTYFDRRALGTAANRVHRLEVTNVIGRHHVWPEYYRECGIARSIADTVYFSR